VILLLEPLVDEFEDSPHCLTRPGAWCANSLQRFDKCIVKLTATERIGADDADVRGIISPAGRTSPVARPERLSSGRGDNGRR
jgi:hypothetical protein